MAGLVERGICKRGSSFQVNVTSGDKRLTATCKTIKEARLKRATLQVQLGTNDGRLEALSRCSKNWTIAEAAEYTGRVAWKKAISSDKMTSLAREAIAFFGKNRRLNTISTQEIDH